jgi:hypothetical protein
MEQSHHCWMQLFLCQRETQGFCPLAGPLLRQLKLSGLGETHHVGAGDDQETLGVGIAAAPVPAYGHSVEQGDDVGPRVRRITPHYVQLVQEVQPAIKRHVRSPTAC